MTIRPTLSKPSDVLSKLKRERWRINQSEDIIDRSDHIYNFCITSNSIKDYIFEHLQITSKEEKNIYHNEWNKHSYLVSCHEISNVVKHYTLRDKKGIKKKPKTKRMTNTTIEMIDFYEDDQGGCFKIHKNYDNYEIETMNNEVFSDLDFTHKVIDYWEKYFHDKSIP
ncbi:MAG: hypothetical protein ACYDGO_06375 [Smithellaceae bacterium]